ncbi:MAG: transcriptional regulator [Spirochaetaceae bacterium]|jgi:DNA-binding MarR family transcriptional regulator|nr:transcriptional regulator [Spirochaetaceae bacterium]
MNEELKTGLLKALYRFKKTGQSISNYLVNEMRSDLNIAEISALRCVKEHAHVEKGCRGKVCEYGKSATAHNAVQSSLSVSKAAVSQTLGGLEKKGYVEREIDRGNRRKIVITLTDSGQAALENSTDALEKLMASLINRFGEAETSKLITLVNDFAELVESFDREPASGFTCAPR